MDDVKLEMSPSQEVVFDAKQPFSTTDSRGRKFTLCKPGLLSQYRLIEALGPELSKNQTYVSMLGPLLWVQSIDGIQTHWSKKIHIDALVQQVDEDGLSAIVEEMQIRGIIANMSDGQSAQEAADAAKTDLKNG